ncbi:hypothetical protein [Paenibacillus sp. MBLB4367]|uniref:hypothetical protein n=1 Tax=Paenibacillus sp. MBLB4367 TaxID=3384767 RepID=UPI003908346E
MDAKKRVNQLFEEIGEYCPFALARHLGVKISHRDDLGEIYGMYSKTSPETNRIFINSSKNIEIQENVCYELVVRHISHPGIQYCITIDDIAKEQASKAAASLKNFMKRHITRMKKAGT